MQREQAMNTQGLLMDISAYIMHFEALFQCCRPVNWNVSPSWFVAQMTVVRTPSVRTGESVVHYFGSRAWEPDNRSSKIVLVFIHLHFERQYTCTVGVRAVGAREAVDQWTVRSLTFIANCKPRSYWVRERETPGDCCIELTGTVSNGRRFPPSYFDVPFAQRSRVLL